MIFGTPIGSRPMPGVISAVLPEPPMPIIPRMSALLRSTHASKAVAIAAIAWPRSSDRLTAAAPSGWQAATAAAETSAPVSPLLVPTSTSRTGTPAAWITPLT